MKPFIKSQIAIRAIVITACGILFSVSSADALDDKSQLKLGEIEFMNNCAACHGADAKGDGPVAPALNKKPSDLTRIAKDFSGIFPEDHLYNVIDGRRMINPHGDTDMPVWGRRYSAMAHKEADRIDFPLREEEAHALAFVRITWLVDYLESIQVK